MAGNKPGPRKGSGGAPRKASPRPDPQGYVRVSVGPPSKGHLEYKQDVVAGLKNPGKRGLVADHRNGKRADNAPSNVRATTRSVNRLNQHPKLTPHPKRK